jgi:ribonucleotide monophosphatase NagD (HAD superfamily)
MKKDPRPKTIICDIDGTLIKHCPPTTTALPDHVSEILPGTIEKLSEWDRLGYNIILITGRRESQRSITVKQLSQLGIIYDQLVMGVGGGVRVLINDTKPDSDEATAVACVIERNIGISNVNV